MKTYHPPLTPNQASPTPLLIILAALLGCAGHASAETPPSTPAEKQIDFWTFSKNYIAPYQSIATESPDADSISVEHRSVDDLVKALSDAQTPDLVELDYDTLLLAAGTNPSPLRLVDLRERVDAGELKDLFVDGAFDCAEQEGRLLGLPMNIHPVMLCYRADVFEAAGIKVEEIDTWDDFERLTRPLQIDLDGDGTIDRRVMDLGSNSIHTVLTLMRQADGPLIDETGRPVFASDANAAVLATAVSWIVSNDPFSRDAPQFSRSANQLRRNGEVLACVMPDWLAGVWRSDLPELRGKVKLMPLPAWRRGGRRSSLWAGSVLALNASSPDLQAAWKLATAIALSPEVAAAGFAEGYVVSPVLEHQKLDIYDQPDLYFSGEAAGRAFLNTLAAAPRRSGSPLRADAEAAVGQAFDRLFLFAEELRLAGVVAPDREKLVAEAKAALRSAQELLLRE